MNHFMLLQASNSQTNMNQLLTTVKTLASQGRTVCLEFAFLMFFVSVVLMLWNVFVKNEGFNLASPIRIFLLILFIFFYNPLMSLVIDAVHAFTDIYADKNTIILKTLKDATEGKNHSMSFPVLGINLPFDSPTSFLTWIIAALENGLSMLVRIIIARFQLLLFAFLYVSGIYAAALSTFQPLHHSLAHWFKAFISVMFWTLTLGILDGIVSFAVDNFKVGGLVVSSGDDTSSLDFLLLNLVIILMYLSVPVLTSMFIGYTAVGQVMSAGQRFLGGLAVDAISKMSNTKSMRAFGGNMKERLNPFKNREKDNPVSRSKD